MFAIYYGYGGTGSTFGLTILLFVMIGISMYSSFKVKSNFSKFSKVASRKGMTGREVAKLILDRKGIYDVTIQPVAGHLSDHYDPRTRTLRLSENVYNDTSIAAISVAAHEVGHAIQHNEDYFFLRFRSTLAPVVSFTSSFVFYLIFLGFILRIAGLIDIGIIAFSFSVLFHIVTLPVEIDASRRAMDEMEMNRIIVIDEKRGVKKVLGAAAMTYLSSMLVSVIQLLRFISMRRN